MLSHVALRVRLVYEAVEPAATRAAGGVGVATYADIPGWRLVGLLPEEITAYPPAEAGEADRASVPVRLVSEPVELTLDRDEAEGYYLNLTSPEPSLFVLLRLPDVAAATASQASAGLPQSEEITASYAEAARWMDGGMVVIRTPLPEPMLAWIAEFAQHHFQVEGRKKRGKFRPSFLSRQEFGEVASSALKELRQETAGAVAAPPSARRH